LAAELFGATSAGLGGDDAAGLDGDEGVVGEIAS